MIAWHAAELHWNSFSLFLGALLAAWSLFCAWRGWRTRNWPAVDGEIVAIEYPFVRHGRNGPVHRFAVRYRYSARGVTREGSRISFSSHEWFGKRSAAAVALAWGRIRGDDSSVRLR